MLFEITYIIAKLAFEGACIKKKSRDNGERPKNLR